MSYKHIKGINLIRYRTCYTGSKSLYIITLCHFYCRFVYVHALWLCAAQTESSTCSKKSKVHISRHDYNELFEGEDSETFVVDRLHCIMTCLKGGEGIKMAAYQDPVLCRCVDRVVESVQESGGTVEVYLVNFNRGEL